MPFKRGDHVCAISLLTHPIAGANGHYRPNQFYDPATSRRTSIDFADVLGKLARLDRSSPASQTS